MERRVLSLSSISLPGFLGRRYYDLEATLFVMGMLSEEKVVDGFELQLLGEWNADYPPISVDSKYDRRMEWEICEKYSKEEIADGVRSRDLEVFSVHANRDVGVCLCSAEEELVSRGRRLMENALSLAEMVGAGICVFHLWDPWIEDIDFGRLRSTFGEVIRSYPGVKAAVENIPTYQKTRSPCELVQDYDWTTVDTKWAVMYGELEAFARLRERIVNVHLRGTLRRGSWRFEGSSTAFDEIIETVLRDWGYDGLVTVEPEDDLSGLQWNEVVHGFAVLRRTSEIL
jgi:sugar phosphate isomerase/epimerase